MKTRTTKCGVFAALAVTLLITAALITSCVEPVNYGGTELASFTPPEGMGYIRLNVSDDKSGAKTVMPTTPTVQFYQVVVTGTGTSSGNNYSPTGGSTVTSPVVVAPGTYSVTVYAYSSSDNTTRIASGTTASDVAVTTGLGGTANVTLKENSTTGSGTFRYNFALPAAPNVVDTAVMNVTTWPAGNTTVAALTNVDVTTTAQIATGVSLPSGFYYVTVALTKAGHAPSTKLEIVHIYENMPTDFGTPDTAGSPGSGTPITFAALNVNEYEVTYNDVDGTGPTATFTDTTKFTHGGTITNYYTTPPTDTTVANRTFGGWFKEAAGTNVWNFTSDVIIKDLDLFAKWVAGENLTVNATVSITGAATFTISPSPITFSQSALGTTAANASVVLSNAVAEGLSNIVWKRNGVAITTTTTSAGGVANDTLNLTFATDSANVGLLVIGTSEITIEAEKGGMPFLGTVNLVISP